MPCVDSYYHNNVVDDYFVLRYVKVVIILCLPHLFVCSDVDHTLTVDNLLAALQSVTDWHSLGQWLNVPLSRRAAMSGMEDLIREWLKHHPAPSWKLVAWALYRTRGVTEHNVLKQLYGTYITGMYKDLIVHSTFALSQGSP